MLSWLQDERANYDCESDFSEAKKSLLAKREVLFVKKLFLPEGHVEIVLCLHNCVCHKLSLNNDNDQQGHLVELSTLTCEN